LVYDDLSEKQLKLLYLASDNNASSGAFLCMVELLKTLRDNYNVYPIVILPFAGTGTNLLKKNNIKYKKINSEDWIVKNDIKCNEIIKKWKNSLKNFYTIIRLIRYIKNNRINIVHNNTIWTYVGAIAAKLSKIPCVWHIRESIFYGMDSKIMIQSGYKLINSSDKIISISNAVLKSYPQIDKSKSVVIYDGVDQNRFYNEKHEIFISDKVKMICAGAIYEQKRQKDLVNACALLLDNGINNWELKIVGLGAVEDLKEYVKERNLDKYIECTGEKDNVQDYMAESDISITPSLFEGFGRVTVEAMLSGCLVVASNSGGTPEIIKNIETGILYEVKNCEDLCKKLMWAINNREQCKYIAQKGRKYAKENFSSQKNAREIYNLYKEILKDK